MTQRIVLFNGPPSCGKDTAARHCFETLKDQNFVVFDRMSMPIKRAFAATLGRRIDRWGNVDFFESCKDDYKTTYGVTYRQWQIDFSERFLKPLYGENIFGRLFIDRILYNQHPNCLVLVPDCGFDVEYKTLTNTFGVENVLVVKIYRPGTSFKNDSRNYLRVGTFGLKRETEQVIHITNDGDENSFRNKVETRIRQWLNDTSATSSMIESKPTSDAAG